MSTYTWEYWPSGNILYFDQCVRSIQCTQVDNLKDMENRLNAGPWPDFSWANSIERAGQGGMVAGDIGLQADVGSMYCYDGAEWDFWYNQGAGPVVEQNVKPDAGLSDKDLVYYYGSGECYCKALSNTGAANENMVGVYCCDGNLVLNGGIIDLGCVKLPPATYPYGTMVYLSDSVAGDVTASVTSTLLGMSMGDGRVMRSGAGGVSSVCGCALCCYCAPVICGTTCLSGPIWNINGSTCLDTDSSFLRITTPSGTTCIGMGNATWSHFYTTANCGFYFANSLIPNGDVRPYTDNAECLGQSSYKWKEGHLYCVIVSSCVSAPLFCGSCFCGNASSASEWATGRCIQLTGNVTGTSTGWTGSGNLSFSTTIANNAVTFSKMQDVTGPVFFGRQTATSGNASALDMATARSMLNVADGANAYVHPSYSYQNWSFTGATVLSYFGSDNTGHVCNITTRTLTLGDLGFTGDTNANDYTHPSDGVDFGAALSGAWVISDVGVNTAGHVTGFACRQISKSDLGLGNVENTALSTWAGSSNLTCLGTITSGVWNAGTITSSGAVCGTILCGSSCLKGQFVCATLDMYNSGSYYIGGTNGRLCKDTDNNIALCNYTNGAGFHVNGRDSSGGSIMLLHVNETDTCLNYCGDTKIKTCSYGARITGTLCASYCVDSPVLCGTTCLETPALCGTTCISSPLVYAECLKTCKGLCVHGCDTDSYGCVGHIFAENGDNLNIFNCSSIAGPSNTGEMYFGFWNGTDIHCALVMMGGCSGQLTFTPKYGENCNFNVNPGNVQAFDLPFYSTVCVCAPVICGTTCTTSPVVCGTTCIVSPVFVGALSGNASTASAWASGRCIQLTGNVTGTSGAWTGSGNLSFSTTIANNAVTFAKMQDVTGPVFFGRQTATSGDASALTMAAARSMLNVENGANHYIHPSYSFQNWSLTGATVLSYFGSDGTGHVCNITTRTLTLADLGFTGDSDANNYTHPSDGVDFGAALTGSNVISDVTVNSAGHVTGFACRSMSKSDLGLGNVENTALSTWTGSGNIACLGTITSGIWNAGTVTSSGAVCGTILCGTSCIRGAFVYSTGNMCGVRLGLSSTSTCTLRFDGGHSSITVHDGYGNFNINSGIDWNRAGSGAQGHSRIVMSHSGSLCIRVGNTLPNGTSYTTAYDTSCFDVLSSYAQYSGGPLCAASSMITPVVCGSTCLNSPVWNIDGSTCLGVSAPYLSITTPNGTTCIGMGNTSYTHMRTSSTNGFWFDSGVVTDGCLRPYSNSVYCVGTSGTRWKEGHFDCLNGSVCLTSPVVCGTSCLKGQFICASNSIFNDGIYYIGGTAGLLCKDGDNNIVFWNYTNGEGFHVNGRDSSGGSITMLHVNETETCLNYCGDNKIKTASYGARITGTLCASYCVETPVLCGTTCFDTPFAYAACLKTCKGICFHECSQDAYGCIGHIYAETGDNWNFVNCASNASCIATGEIYFKIWDGTCDQNLLTMLGGCCGHGITFYADKDGTKVFSISGSSSEVKGTGLPICSDTCINSPFVCGTTCIASPVFNASSCVTSSCYIVKDPACSTSCSTIEMCSDDLRIFNCHYAGHGETAIGYRNAGGCDVYYLYAAGNGGVNLFFSGANKFSTQSYGVRVCGNALITGTACVAGAVSINNYYDNAHYCLLCNGRGHVFFTKDSYGNSRIASNFTSFSSYLYYCGSAKLKTCSYGIYIYGSISCSSLTCMKTDIQLLDCSDLQKRFLDTGIFSFRMKDEGENARQRYGLLADHKCTIKNFPELLTYDNRGGITGINFMNQVGVLHAVTKQNVAKTNVIDLELKKAKKEIQELKQELACLRKCA